MLKNIFLSNIMVNRYGCPEDIAYACVYFGADESECDRSDHNCGRRPEFSYNYDGAVPCHGFPYLVGKDGTAEWIRGKETGEQAYRGRQENVICTQYVCIAEMRSFSCSPCKFITDIYL